MSGIDYRNRRSYGTKRYVTNAGGVSRKGRSKTEAGEIEFLRQRTLSRVQRQILEEATIVVPKFRPTLAKRIDGNTETRRPLVREGVGITRAGSVRAANHALLFPTQTDNRGDVPVYSPRVLDITGVIVAVRVEAWRTEFTAIDLQRNRHVRASDIKAWAECASRIL